VPQPNVTAIQEPGDARSLTTSEGGKSFTARLWPLFLLGRADSSALDWATGGLPAGKAKAATGRRSPQTNKPQRMRRCVSANPGGRRQKETKQK